MIFIDGLIVLLFEWVFCKRKEKIYFKWTKSINCKVKSNDVRCYL